MSDKIVLKDTDGAILNLDDLVVNDTTDGSMTTFRGGSSIGASIDVSSHSFGPAWQDPVDHSVEIASLKKEIQELKDMLAEHILLGHQE